MNTDPAAIRAAARQADPLWLGVGLAMVVRHAPDEVWPVLAGFYEIATRVERERLNAIVSAAKPFAYDETRTGAGALFEVPLKLMLDWVKADPDARIGFLLTFFPILEQNGEVFAWHPALQQLAKLYGGGLSLEHSPLGGLRARLVLPAV